jgi:pimeloyl-ACP methyl ester carboxylesterase
VLFYNYFNPRAARDNNLQSAAELFQAVRLIEVFDDQAGIAAGLDPDSIYFIGHSQGTQGAFLGALFEPKIGGFVLSGAGGLLIETLLNKPLSADDIFTLADYIQILLGERTVDRAHPLLNLIQSAMDCVDPASYASLVFQEDLTGMGIAKRSLFMTAGLDDTATPVETQFALARALGVMQWAPPGVLPFDVSAIPLVAALPHQNTFADGITTVVGRYLPDGDYDGHHVMFYNPEAVTQTDEFVRTMIDPAWEAPVLVDPF